MPSTDPAVTAGGTPSQAQPEPMRPVTHESELFRRLVARQRGLLTVEQAITLGHTEASIRRRVATKRWSRPLPGVLLVAPLDLTPEMRVMSAALWAGQGLRPVRSRDGNRWRLALPSDLENAPPPVAVDAETACWLLRFHCIPKPGPNVRLVSGLDSSLRSTGFVKVRQTIHPVPSSTLTMSWVPILAPADAAVSAAARLANPDLSLAVLAEALRRGRGRTGVLAEALTRAPRRAAARLEAAAVPLLNGTQTLGEARFRALAQGRTDLPELRYNWLLELPCGRRVAPDALAPDAPLIHEVNGYEVHAARRDDFADFQSRHNALEAAGFHALHNAPERLRTSGSEAIAQFCSLYGQLAGRGYPAGVRVLRASPPM